MKPGKRFACGSAALALAASVLAAVLTAELALAQDSTPDVADPATGEASEGAGEELSESERLQLIEETMASDREELEELREEAAQQEREYQSAVEELEKIDAELEAARASLAEAEAAGSAEAAEGLRPEVERLERERALTQRHADLWLENGRNIKKGIALLEHKIAAAEETLALEHGDVEPEATAAAPPPGAPAPAVTTPAVPGVGALVPGGIEPPPAEPPPSLEETPEQIEARLEAERAAREAMEAQEAARDFVALRNALEEQIALEKSRLEVTRKERDNLHELLDAREDELTDRMAAGASPEEIGELRREVNWFQKELRSTGKELEARGAQLEELRDRLARSRVEQLRRVREAEEAREEAEEAQDRSVWLQSPFHPENLERWLLERGPRVLIVIAAAFATLLLLRFTARPAARLAARPGRRTRGDPISRADTLSQSFQSVATVVILLGAVLLVFQEAGLDVTAILGGAAIVGLAVAFGAQNLMQDYFSGFLILVEDQYGLGDLVTIGGITGTVEKVNMRTTMLRDFEGRMHFIPNGQIRSITNRTYGWARILADVTIGYEQDAERAMKVIAEVGEAIQDDPEWGEAVTERPELLGVERFTEAGTVIRLVVRTRPDRYFALRRELLRQIKARLDEDGIRLAVPGRRLLVQPEGPRREDPG